MLHEFCSRLPRFHFPFDAARIPRDGIYVVFEKGETAHNTDRIVRIGTHTGVGQLRSRLHQHFSQENKDRSIFRKNIGRALLRQNHDDFLADWEIDLTPRVAREAHGKRIDLKYQQKVEAQVTTYMHEFFSFVVVPVPDKVTRLELESKIIATVAQCPDCKATTGWLGHHSSVEKIRQSGLWQVNELEKFPLDQASFSTLKASIVLPVLHRRESDPPKK